MHLASVLKEWADFDYELKVVDNNTLGYGYDANYICSIAKEINGNIITAIGGSYAISILSDLVHYPNTNIFVVEEGGSGN